MEFQSTKYHIKQANLLLNNNLFRQLRGNFLAEDRYQKLQFHITFEVLYIFYSCIFYITFKSYYLYLFLMYKIFIINMK